MIILWIFCRSDRLEHQKVDLAVESFDEFANRRWYTWWWHAAAGFGRGGLWRSEYRGVCWRQRRDEEPADGGRDRDCQTADSRLPRVSSLPLSIGRRTRGPATAQLSLVLDSLPAGTNSGECRMATGFCWFSSFPHSVFESVSFSVADAELENPWLNFSKTKSSSMIIIITPKWME